MELKKEFYTVTELAEMLDVDHQSIRREIKRGRLKGYKVARTLRINREDLQEYLEQNCTAKHDAECSQ